MDIHAKKGLVDECLKIYHESQKYPYCKFDESLMSAALRACCNMRCIEKAEDLVAAAEAEGIVIPLACYNWLILGTYIPQPGFHFLQCFLRSQGSSFILCLKLFRLPCTDLFSVMYFLNHVWMSLALGYVTRIFKLHPTPVKPRTFIAGNFVQVMGRKGNGRNLKTCLRR